ncbi:extracellular solute-binding protein [Cohnella zeiphila]|uniref:Extracellular solute-binding protein n=1 Tax=Cohnella zeiphila TaxID=2761120 RepID=A0A7X0SUI0_9BACL|nr:extracellular solute-binding protein [Cohnella zeiphila]MBB6734118.1 extracellular solute-binding protein [Cohnella zeiphila]
MGKGSSALKQFSSFLAVVTILSFILSACSNDKESSDGSAAPSGNPSKDLHILLSHSNAKYAMQVKDNDPYIKELSKLSGYNLNFEFLGHGNDFTQQMTVRFASGDLPDLIRTDSIDSTMHPGALENGVFADLTDLLDKYGQHIKASIPEEAWKSPRVSKDGKIFGIPTLSALPASRVVYIRQDWLDKLGMDTPVTLDDYLAYFEAVKREDMNGNGDPNDEYGFYVRENLIYSNLFFTEFGAEPGTWYYRDGQLQPGIIQPEIKDSLKFWKQLYDKGYINPNLFTNKASDWEAGIKQGKAGLWVHDVTNYNSNWGLPEFYVNQEGAKVSMIQSPEGPKGHGLSAQGDQIYFVWVVPAANGKAEEAIKFLDWAWSQEADDFFALGIEGNNYKVENGKPVWSLEDPANKDNDASVFYQLSINPRGDGRMSDRVLDVIPNSEAIKGGIETALKDVYPNDGLHMPTLEAFKNRPELVPGTGAGTLFLDMFSKVITGKEPLEPAFDKFVAEWRRRGGDEAIREATDWYRAFHNQ